MCGHFVYLCAFEGTTAQPSGFDWEQVIGVFNSLNLATQSDLKFLKINTKVWAALYLNGTTWTTERNVSVTAYLDSKLGLDTSRERADIQYNVAVAQTCGAGSVPAGMRCLPPPPSPLFGSLCGATMETARPGLYTWNTSCLVEAPPLFCVFQKLCTDPQVKWKGLRHSTERPWDGRRAQTPETYLLRLKILQWDLMCCCPR